MAFNRKAKLRDNIEALRTVFTLEKERRAATPEEREILSRYCGFGGLKFILNPAGSIMDSVHWAKSDRELFPMTVELHRLVRDNSTDEKEYKRYMDSIKSSVLTAFYTPPAIVSAIADTLHENGITPDRLLDPSAGQGVFISAFGAHAPKAEVMAFDKDLLTGKLLSHLYPGHKIRAEGFERIEKPFMGTFDVAASNIPFGDMAVFDPEFTGAADYSRRAAAKSIHNYFFLKGLDAVREGGIVAFITSKGVLNSPKNEPVRHCLMKNANIVSVVRLPDNMFSDHAGTDVGSDLVILQKDTMKKRELSMQEKWFIQTEDTGDGIMENQYMMSVAPLSHTTLKRGTDPYGKPALLTIHPGNAEAMAADLKEHLGISIPANLNIALYNKYRQDAPEMRYEPTREDWREAGEVMLESERKLWKEQPPQPEDFEKRQPEVIQEPEPVKKEEKPEIVAPVMDLYDLFNFTQEEKRLAGSGLTKKRPGKSSKKSKRTPSAAHNLFDQPNAKAQEPAMQAEPEIPSTNPEEVYAAINWETNPPINGFYEAMMRFTPQERERLRQGKSVAPQPRTGAIPEHHREELEREEQQRIEEELMNPRPLMGKLEPHHKEGMLVSDGNQVGYLKGLTRYGATFHPLDLDKAQQEKAELYITMRDSYQRLYTYEAEMHQENKPEREALNAAYDTFTGRFGCLNAKANVKFLLMDTSGRDMLSLERVENGQFIKADIFDHPVAFALNEVTHVDTPQEALSASLNRYGEVNLDYMETLCDNSREELVSQLKGQIFFNPLADNYEIKDRFIAGNVVEKTEQIEAWINGNKPDERVDEALAALKEALPRPITFDELDFNFGERWIPTGIYTAYIKHLFETDVKIAYSESIDEYSVKCADKNAKINDQYAVQGYYRKYDGINLLKNALLNTVPDITKSIGKDEHGNDIKVRDSEAIQLANAKIDEIRNGFTDWLNEQSPEFQQRLADRYNRKFNCFVRPSYDGTHQNFPGLDLKALEKKYGINDVYQSQKDCVWMLKQNGGGICDHEVLRP